MENKRNDFDKVNISEVTDDSNLQNSDTNTEVSDELENITLCEKDAGDANSNNTSSNASLSSQSQASAVPNTIAGVVEPTPETGSSQANPPLQNTMQNRPYSQNTNCYRRNQFCPRFIHSMPSTSGASSSCRNNTKQEHSPLVKFFRGGRCRVSFNYPLTSSAPLREGHHPAASNESVGGSSPLNLDATESERCALQGYPCPDCTRIYSSFSLLSKHREYSCITGRHPRGTFECFYCYQVLWLLEDNVGTSTGDGTVCCKKCRRALDDMTLFYSKLQHRSSNTE